MVGENAIKRTPMLEQYFAVKQTCEDALLLFRLGDFYELFFDDALLASAVLDLTLTGRGQGENRAPMCGVPYHAADNYIAKLVSSGHKVAICDQMEDPKSVKGIVKREITRLITPGTGFDYLKDDESRTLVATVMEADGEAVGAVANPLTGEVFMRTDERQRLQHWFLQLGVSEVVASAVMTDVERTWLEGLSEKAKCAFSVLPKEESLRPQPVPSAPELLTRYLEYTGKRKLAHMKLPVVVDDVKHLEISASALVNLELLSPLREGRKGATLLEVLDFTKTAMGKRHLKEMIARPLRKAVLIAGRQDSVAAWLEDVITASEVEAILRRVHDLERLVSRISFASALPRDLVQLARSLEAATELGVLLATKSLRGEAAQLMQRLADFTPLFETIRTKLVDDPVGTGKEGGIIRDGFDDEVDRLRDLVRGGRTFIAALEQSERVRTGIKSLKIGYNRVFGYYIEVSGANLHLVPADYERKQTLTNAERFVTSELRKREQEILAADDKLKELEYSHFLALMDSLTPHLRLIQESAEAIGQLDALLSLAEAARRHRYTRPEIDESLELVIRQGRHPVVEHHVQGDYVPNDARLNADARQIALITGPNMAGKSTYMRQVAQIVILAQMGSFVPADFAHIGIVDKLFTRIGASDDVSAGLSTFMVEMTEAAEIMREATQRSLIVLDEIGRGTATYDGLSIAEAMVEYLHDHLRARTLFATHYHELTALPKRLPRAFNLSVAVVEHGDDIVFLHQIVERAADRSYGIQVAQIAGLPVEVTKRAKRILHSLESGQRAISDEGEQLAMVFDEAQDETCQEIRRELARNNLDDFTPRRALNFLYEWQARLKEE